MPAPPDLGFVLDNTCHIVNDTQHINLNQLSMVVHADLLRRLMTHSDIPVQSQFPSIEIEDIHSIQYGAETSDLFPGLQWGGMSTDTAIYAQSALDMTEVDNRSQGMWRIFSKLGAGWDSDRNVGEILSAVYASLPIITSEGEPVPDMGVEFILVGRASIPGDSSLLQADAVLQEAISKIVKAVYEGQLA
jgi:hypothetical protein